LYTKYDEFDNAALTMLNHSAEAWEHALFKDVVAKVANLDICYRAVQFYISEHPLLVNDLLGAVSNRVDHARVVGIARKMFHLPLIKGYLVAVQEKNVTAVNEALNELYIEEEDFESLRTSIDHYDAYEPIQLAQKLEKHELLEFRRIAAYLYKKNARWAQSVELSKQDKLYKDAIQTAADSKKQDVAEGLLEFFVAQGLKECFAACLYTCYDNIRPDVALELAWKNKIIDYAFPFLIQVVREYTSKVDVMHKEFEKRQKDEQKKSEEANLVSQPAHHEESSLFMPAVPQIAYYPTDQMPIGMVPQMYPGMPGSMSGPMPGAFGGYK